MHYTAITYKRNTHTVNSEPLRKGAGSERNSYSFFPQVRAGEMCQLPPTPFYWWQPPRKQLVWGASYNAHEKQEPIYANEAMVRAPRHAPRTRSPTFAGSGNDADFEWLRTPLLQSKITFHGPRTERSTHVSIHYFPLLSISASFFDCDQCMRD